MGTCLIKITLRVLKSGFSYDRKTDIRTVSDPVFLEKASENTLEIYQRVMWSVQERYGPVIEVFEVEGSRERSDRVLSVG